MQLIGYHTNDNVIANSNGEVVTELPYLDWLLSETESIKVFWHLDYSVARILSLIEITEQQARKLLETGRLHDPPYELKYIPKRFFSIKKGASMASPFVFFNDVGQYHGETPKPSDSPIERAREAQKLGEHVANILKGITLEEPTSLASPVSVFQKQILRKLDLPTIDDIPLEAAQLAYECCDGNWVEAFKIGYWRKAYDYDIISAYPWQVAQLVDTRSGNWLHIPIYQADALYGYCKCSLAICASFNPIIFRQGNSSNFTPTGEWQRVLTKAQIDFIRKWNLGTVEILDGWWWIPEDRDKLERPLAPWIEYLNKLKSKSSGLDLAVVKRIMAGIWGKFLETQKNNTEFGELFNPVWGAEVETRVRLQVAEFCLQNNIVPIHIAVDGVVLDKETPTAYGKEMGEWKLSAVTPCICIGSGIIALKEKYGGLDFSLDFTKICRTIRGHPNNTEQSVKKIVPITLARALALNKWKDMGKFEVIERTIYLTSERKRLYNRKPVKGIDLLKNTYESYPLDTSMLEIKELEG